ncbi:MAG: carboxypeptidase regulatory-like domain-containing protein [Phycisphaerales bacterium]|nr:carboxypeptidase regulatory-like domain-containing protein [Phycisphaerales bacterium]
MSKPTLAVWSLIAIVCALALAAFAPQAQAGDERAPAVIAGLVSNPAGTAIAGAEVRLVNAEGKVVKVTRTGPRGHFEFAPIKPGRYLVQAAKADVGKGQEKVIAPGGEVTRVKITLRKK